MDAAGTLEDLSARSRTEPVDASTLQPLPSPTAKRRRPLLHYYLLLPYAYSLSRCSLLFSYCV